MNGNKYILYKDKKNNDIVYLEYPTKRKLEILPKNQLENILSVEKLVIISNDFSKKIVNKIIKKKLKNLVDALIQIIEEDGANSEAISLLIQDCEKFKMTCINKYMEHLTPEQMEELFSKVDLIYNHVKQLRTLDFDMGTFGRRR